MQSYAHSTAAVSGPQSSSLLRLGDVVRLFNVYPTTIRRSTANGSLACLALPSGHRRFREQDVLEWLGISPKGESDSSSSIPIAAVIRVSTSNQNRRVGNSDKSSLDHQEEGVRQYIIQRWGNKAKVKWFRSAAPGMNFERKEFLSLIADVLAGKFKGGYKSTYQLYHRLFTGRGELSQLSNHANLGIALQSRWARRFKKDPKSKPVDAQFLLGYLEGRTQLEVPTRWAALFTGAFNPRSSLKDSAFANSDVIELDGFWRVKQPQFSNVEGSDIRVAEGSDITVKNGEVLVQKTPLEYELSQHVLPSRLRCTSRGLNQQMFLALYYEDGYNYWLYRVNAMTGKVLWKSRVWARGFHVPGIGTGGPYHFVEIAVSKEFVGVFDDWNGFTCYAEIFDTRSGKNICRFTTDDFESLARQSSSRK